MRVAALYDIHGNLPALEAVLREIRHERFDRIVVGGDVLPGPMPRETMACLLDLDIPVQFIRGNGDRAVIELLFGTDPVGVPAHVRPLIRHSADALDSEQRHAVASWPDRLRMEIDGIGEVLFCHATPRNDTEIFTQRTPDSRLLAVFAGITARVVVCGHTHMSFDRMLGAVRVVNAGSVGMPFADPGAYWASLGPDVRLRRTSYDVAAAAQMIRASDYPQADDFAANNILQPPSEQKMLDAFGQAELK